MARTAVILVHGLFSSPEVWKPLQEALGEDRSIARDFDFVPFRYDSPRLRLDPLRRPPDFDTISLGLREVVVRLSDEYDRLVLLSHSQGGLIVQRFLAAMLNDGRGEDLAKIRRVVLSVPPSYIDELETYDTQVIVIGGNATEFVVHGGPLEQLRDVDIITTSENTYFQMSQTFKPSTSGRLRRAAARKKGDGSTAVVDVASEGLTSWLNVNHGFGLPVVPGTVAPTPAGSLEERGIKRIYHAAITSPQFGDDSGDYQVTPRAVGDAIHNIFQQARRDRAEIDRSLRSICLPLFGAGRGGLDAEASFDRILRALRAELVNDPSWSIHLVSWNPADVEMMRRRLRDHARRNPAGSTEGSPGY